MPRGSLLSRPSARAVVLRTCARRPGHGAASGQCSARRPTTARPRSGRGDGRRTGAGQHGPQPTSSLVGGADRGSSPEWWSRAATEFVLAEGDEQHLVLELGAGPVRHCAAEPDHVLVRHRSHMARIGPVLRGDGSSTRHPAQAFAVLRGLSSPGGGTAAAVTTSLPERAEQGRNYDYRYSWIRDQCFVGRAAAVAGEEPELMDTSVSFVVARLLEDGPDLAPAYTVEAAWCPR